MLKTPPVTIMVAAIGATLILSGCSSQLKLARQEPSYVLELREEYFAANPQGEHNELIQTGAVVKGMGALEVLCAWGHPDVWRKRTSMTELWVYRDVDEDTEDWLEFEFVFKNGVLHQWEIRRHLSNGRSIDIPAGDDTAVLTRDVVTTGKRVPGN